MAAVSLRDLARMTVSSSGTGTITLNAAVSGFLTFDLAGCSTAAAGEIIRYAVSDTTQSEIAYGTYTSSALTLTRGSSTNGMKSTNSNTPINMSNAAQVLITPQSRDFVWAADTANATATTALALTVSNTFTATGATALSSTLTVSGATVLSSALTVTGTATMGVVNMGAGTATTPPTGDNDTSIATTAFVRGDIPRYGVVTGTKMLFVQSAAPTYWTKDVDQDNKALRIVSSAAGTGGSSPFSTVFGITATDGHTLATSEIPSHTHAVNTNLMVGFAVSGGELGYDVTNPNFGQSGTVGGTSPDISATTASGGGGSHTHPIDLRVQYVDVIKATKD